MDRGSASAERRRTSWGGIVVFPPGVGVELVGDADESYADFIGHLIEVVSRSAVGRALLAQLDPAGAGKGCRQLAAEDYRGVTVLVTATGTGAIRTDNVGERLDQSKRATSASTKIPRIGFPAAPREGEKRSIPKSDACITARGVEGHTDFPSSVQPYDVVFYHELVHAYLLQTGVATRLREFERIPAHDMLEEEWVVGILAGKGLPLCENAYRREVAYELRQSYKDVGILSDPDLDKSFWGKDARPTDLLDAVINAPVKPQQPIPAGVAKYIVSGGSKPDY